MSKKGIEAAAKNSKNIIRSFLIGIGSMAYTMQ